MLNARIFFCCDAGAVLMFNCSCSLSKSRSIYCDLYWCVNVISFVWAGRIRTKLSSHWEYHSATRRRIGCKAVGYKKKCGTGMVHLRTDRLTGNNKYSSFSFSFFWGSIVFSQMFIPSHVNAYTCKTWWQTLNHTSTPHDTVWIMCIQWIATIRRVFPEIFLTEFLCWFFDPSDVLSLNDPRCCYII